jgi:hypothetical protein
MSTENNPYGKGDGSGVRYTGQPQLPPDLLGVYILLPIV